MILIIKWIVIETFSQSRKSIKKITPKLKKFVNLIKKATIFTNQIYLIEKKNTQNMTIPIINTLPDFDFFIYQFNIINQIII